MKKLYKIKGKSITLGIVSCIGFFLLFGILTAVVPTPWFTRMTPVTSLDWFFLMMSSLLLGAYIGVHFYKKKTAKSCNAAAATGSAGSFLAFACPICNKLLVALFGTTLLLTYFEPYRPLLGFASNALLGAALYWRIKK